MGVKEAENIVLAIANKTVYETNDVKLDKLFERLWVHSLACAYAARSLAARQKLPDVEKYFFMGLMHDIGKPLLLKLLSQSSYNKTEFDIEGIIFAIQEVHTTFGGMSLKRWGFREDFVNVVKRHDDNDVGPHTNKEILIIHLANNLCRETGHSLFEADTALADLKSAKLLKADGETLNTIAEEIKGLMYETVGAF